jgi:hypothetical protein
MEYTEAVRIGKKLVLKHGNTCWETGDLMLELAPQSRDGVQTGTKATIEQWMVDVESPWAFKTLMGRRKISYQWPKGKRAKASYSVHEALAYHPDRFTLIRDDMKNAEARKLSGHRVNPLTNRTAASASDLLETSNGFLRSVLKRISGNTCTENELERIGELLNEADELRDELAEALGMVHA